MRAIVHGMRVDRLLSGVGAVVAGAALVPYLGYRKWSWETERRVQALHELADRPQRRERTPTDLPEPVADYFDTVLEDERPIGRVRLSQVGKLRTGDASSPWRPFTATHHVTTNPPGFLWDARVEFVPFVPVRVRDTYCGGDGAGEVALFGLLSLGASEASPELNEAELMRYLAEAVWYPTALRPETGVEWTAVDAETAEATLEHGGASATLTFTFEDGLVRRVHADARYRSVDDGFEPTPWTGRWDDYELRHGVRVPTTGDVIWHLDDGDLHAWRGRLRHVEYHR